MVDDEFFDDIAGGVKQTAEKMNLKQLRKSTKMPEYEFEITKNIK